MIVTGIGKQNDLRSQRHLGRGLMTIEHLLQVLTVFRL